MADFTIFHDCVCACIKILDYIGFDSWGGAEHPYLDYNTGEARLTPVSTPESPQCDCAYEGTATLYEYGLYEEYGGLEVAIKLTVHDNERVYMELRANSAGGVFTYRTFAGDIDWEHTQKNCWEWPTPPDTGPSTPYLPPDPSYGYVTLYSVEEGSSGPSVRVRIGGDICCRRNCVTALPVDTDWFYPVGHLTEHTAGGPECPLVYQLDWPWPYDGIVVPFDPEQYWGYTDCDEYRDEPLEDSPEKFMMYRTNRTDTPLLGMNFPNYCEADCCDLLTQDDWNTNVLMHEEDWWELNAEDQPPYGWKKASEADPADITSYGPCDIFVLNYRCESWISFELAYPPNFRLTVPCSLPCKIYGIDNYPEYESLLTGNDLLSNYSGELPGDWQYLELRTDRFKFEQVHGDPSKVYCNDGVPTIAPYEHVCTTEIPIFAPTPEITSPCNGAPQVIMTISSTSEELWEYGLYDQYWGFNGEARVLCVSGGSYWGPFGPDPNNGGWFTGPTGTGPFQDPDTVDKNFPYYIHYDHYANEAFSFYWFLFRRAVHTVWEWNGATWVKGGDGLSEHYFLNACVIDGLQGDQVWYETWDMGVLIASSYWEKFPPYPEGGAAITGNRSGEAPRPALGGNGGFNVGQFDGTRTGTRPVAPAGSITYKWYRDPRCDWEGPWPF